MTAKVLFSHKDWDDQVCIGVHDVASDILRGSNFNAGKMDQLDIQIKFNKWRKSTLGIQIVEPAIGDYAYIGFQHNQVIDDSTKQ